MHGMSESRTRTFATLFAKIEPSIHTGALVHTRPNSKPPRGNGRNLAAKASSVCCIPIGPGCCPGLSLPFHELTLLSIFGKLEYNSLSAHIKKNEQHTHIRTQNTTKQKIFTPYISRSEFSFLI